MKEEENGLRRRKSVYEEVGDRVASVLVSGAMDFISRNHLQRGHINSCTLRSSMERREVVRGKEANISAGTFLLVGNLTHGSFISHHLRNSRRLQAQA